MLRKGNREISESLECLQVEDLRRFILSVIFPVKPGFIKGLIIPYIKQKDRVRLKDINSDINSSGELNYTFTCIIDDYLFHKGVSYQICNDIIGALEGAKMEFYRRVVGTLEDKKIIENGDVYDKEFIK